jgi:hypothetical protein
MIRSKNIVSFIYGCAFGLLIATFQKCSKYQVVQEVRVNLYHLHNPKTKDAEVILTKDTLEVGKFYRLKEINIIPSPYYSKPNLKSR